jgi:S1-C subfamily serine protease
VTSPFSEFEVAQRLRPTSGEFGFDLEQALSAVVSLEATVPEDAFTAQALGTERVGNGIVIDPAGLVLTIGYLITEAEGVTLTTVDGRRTQAHVLGFDHVTGLGLVHALEPLGVPALKLGDSRALKEDDAVIVAGGGGAAHALVGKVVAREAFAGYWEYRLDEALFTAPAHPHWSGAALIGPTGELVGVGSLQLEQALGDGETVPLNMSVPAELLAPILEDLSHGRAAEPARPWLGLFSQDFDGHVVIFAVAAGGPADRAELRRGDVVLAVDDAPVADLSEFYQHIWSSGPAGVHVSLTVSRGGDVFDVSLRSIDRASILKRRRFN